MNGTKVKRGYEHIAPLLIGVVVVITQSIGLATHVRLGFGVILLVVLMTASFHRNRTYDGLDSGLSIALLLLGLLVADVLYENRIADTLFTIVLMVAATFGLLAFTAYERAVHAATRRSPVVYGFHYAGMLVLFVIGVLLLLNAKHALGWAWLLFSAAWSYTLVLNEQRFPFVDGGRSQDHIRH